MHSAGGLHVFLRRRKRTRFI